MYLPKAEKQEATQLIVKEEHDVVPTGNESILIVDDEEELLDVAYESLKILGYQVYKATSAEQAIELLKMEEADYYRRLGLIVTRVILVTLKVSLVKKQF